MKKLLSLLIVMCLTSLAVAPPSYSAEVLARYANLNYGQGEQAPLPNYGVSFYRDGDHIYGWVAAAISEYDLRPGDLYEIHYDEVTKLVSFKAKLDNSKEYRTEAGTRDADDELPDLRILLNFSGQMIGNALVGQMVTKDGYHPHRKGKAAYVILKQEHGNYSPPPSFKEWQKNNDAKASW